MVCKILSDITGYLLQLLLGILGLSTLIIKFKFEKVKRSRAVFLRDVGKQIFGSCIAHLWNIIFAFLLQSNVNKESDQCVLYFVNYVIDCSVGLILTCLSLKLLDYMAIKYNWIYFHSGKYLENQVNFVWTLQLISWLLIITLVKWFVFATVIYPFRHTLISLGHYILSSVIGHDSLELIIVMVLVPLIFNILQFVVQDMVLKYNKPIQNLSLLDHDLLNEDNYNV